MKQSHFITPRTIEECYFDLRGEAIEPMPMRHRSILQWFISLFMPSKGL
jgi:hypothetical protein